MKIAQRPDQPLYSQTVELERCTLIEIEALSLAEQARRKAQLLPGRLPSVF